MIETSFSLPKLSKNKKKFNKFATSVKGTILIPLLRLF